MQKEWDQKKVFCFFVKTCNPYLRKVMNEFDRFKFLLPSYYVE